MFEASPEYRVEWSTATNSGTDSHLGRINAAAAYARGATGAGETIVIRDSGIRDTHREFAGSGKVAAKVTNPGYVPTDHNKFHGTLVAALAVGNRDGGEGLNMHGVAFDARVAFSEVPLGVGSSTTHRVFNLEHYWDLGFSNTLRDIFTLARDNDAAIASFSFGQPGSIVLYSREQVHERMARTATTLEQADTPDADKIIVVWAAGNAGGKVLANGDPAEFSSPELWPGMGVYFPELRSHVLAAVALDQDGKIAGYSNYCGAAKSFCLAAPGSHIVSATYSSDTAYSPAKYSGTSFAAPIVSGSLAVLRQFFRRQLGNTELVARLLATANREGIYADSDIYGQGLLDLDAATAPVGVLMAGLPGTAAGKRPLGGGIALSGGAFGASMQGALAGLEVAGFDALGAPFFQSAGGWVTRAAAQSTEATQTTAVIPLSTAWNAGGLRQSSRRLPKLALTHDNSGEVTAARLGLSNGWWFAHGDSVGASKRLSSNGEPGFAPYSSPARNGLGLGSSNTLSSNSNLGAAPYLSLVRDGPGLGWSNPLSGNGNLGFALIHGSPQFDGEQKPGGKRGTGALLSMTVADGLSLQAGAVHEADGFLGATASGGFGETHAATTFVGANRAWTASRWHLRASAWLGHTKPKLDTRALLHEVSNVLSSAFAISAARPALWQPDDWLALRLSQPLRVESGDIKLRLPTARTKYGEVLTRDHKISLTPTGRTLQAEATYHLPTPTGTLQTNIGITHHPQHTNSKAAQPYIRWSYTRSF